MSTPDLADKKATAAASKKEIADPLTEETDVGHRDDSDLGFGGMTTKALSVSGVG